MYFTILLGSKAVHVLKRFIWAWIFLLLSFSELVLILHQSILYNYGIHT